jgi:hypothetical protein
MKTADHPTLPFTITLNDRHVYADNEGSVYLSGTAFVKRFFKPFDSEHHASRIAARTGEDPARIAAAWAAKGKAAAEWGTLVHAHAEEVINGLEIADARNERERQAFSVVDKTIAALCETYDFIGAELIVFDPLYLLAGTIDLLAVNRETGELAIFDWKTCGKIEDVDYGKRGLPPIEHVNDSKIQHYRLQLALYDAIHDCLGAPSRPSATLALLHIPPGASGAAYVILDPARDEIEAMAEAWWRDKAGKYGRKDRIAAMVDPLIQARAGMAATSLAPSETDPAPDRPAVVELTPRNGKPDAVSESFDDVPF